MPIQAEIGLNVSPFLKGAQEVKAATERMLKDTQAAHSRHGSAEHGFGTMRGERSAEKGLVKMSEGLLQARSGSEALAIGLERVGRVMHLGLGLGVAAHLAGFLIEKHDKLMEQYEQLKEKSEALAQASREAVESGDFSQNVAMLAKQIQLTEELGKARKQHMGVGGFLGEVFSGSMITGSGREARNDSRKQEAESVALQKELAEAGLADLRLQSQIADLKANGHTEEAAALERERKLKIELLRIDHSALSPGQKREARELVTNASESNASAAEAARQRADQLADEKEIAALYEKESGMYEHRARLGETEEQKTARLVDEVSALTAKYDDLTQRQGTSFAREGDALRITQARVAAAGKMNELADLAAAKQAKLNAEEERRAKSREEAMPGLMQNAYGLAAAASGNEEGMAEVDRRKRYADHLKKLKADGFADDPSSRFAASMTRLEDLKKLQEQQDSKRGSVGRADANRTLGLGGGAERGSDVHAALARRQNDLTARIHDELQKLNTAFAAMKPVKLDQTARFAP
jgi:hypothetical protein